MKTHLLVLLQDNCLGLVCCAFLHNLICEEYNSILSTPTEADADKISHGYIGETQISARYISLSLLCLCVL